jgi:hypothetical protein
MDGSPHFQLRCPILVRTDATRCGEKGKLNGGILNKD